MVFKVNNQTENFTVVVELGNPVTFNLENDDSCIFSVNGLGFEGPVEINTENSTNGQYITNVKNVYVFSNNSLSNKQITVTLLYKYNPYGPAKYSTMEPL